VLILYLKKKPIKLKYLCIKKNINKFHNGINYINFSLKMSKKTAGRPDPPKRPMSAYFLFLNDIRPDLKKE